MEPFDAYIYLVSYTPEALAEDGDKTKLAADVMDTYLKQHFEAFELEFRQIVFVQMWENVHDKTPYGPENLKGWIRNQLKYIRLRHKSKSARREKIINPERDSHVNSTNKTTKYNNYKPPGASASHQNPEDDLIFEQEYEIWNQVYERFFGECLGEISDHIRRADGRANFLQNVAWMVKIYDDEDDFDWRQLEAESHKNTNTHQKNFERARERILKWIQVSDLEPIEANVFRLIVRHKLRGRIEQRARSVESQ